MDRSLSKEVVKQAGLVAISLIGVYLMSIIVHEVSHLLVNVVATGEIRMCGFGPFTTFRGLPATCLVQGGVPGWNVLLAPLVTAIFGLAAVLATEDVRSDGFSLGLFLSGVIVWFQQVWYGAAHLSPIRGDVIRPTADGALAIWFFGPKAVLPAIGLFVIGLLVVRRAVSQV